MVTSQYSSKNGPIHNLPSLHAENHSSKKRLRLYIWAYWYIYIYIYKSFKLNELALSATNPPDIKAILENKIVAEEEIGT